MPELKMIEILHTIEVQLKRRADDPGYRIRVNKTEITFEAHTLQDAISHLREGGHNAAQVVNGPEVYIITWGPLLAPWEGEPG